MSKTHDNTQYAVLESRIFYGLHHTPDPFPEGSVHIPPATIPPHWTFIVRTHCGPGMGRTPTGGQVTQAHLAGSQVAGAWPLGLLWGCAPCPVHWGAKCVRTIGSCRHRRKLIWIIYRRTLNANLKLQNFSTKDSKNIENPKPTPKAYTHPQPSLST